MYPDLDTDKYHIDILTAHFVLHPDWFGVVVGSNLFGDILSDLGPAVAGSSGSRPRPISTRKVTTHRCSWSTAAHRTSPVKKSPTQSVRVRAR